MADLGSSGSSISHGTAADNHLNGGAGNDQLFGLGGSDKLNAGAGADTVDGGSGSDRVSGDSGDDVAVYAVGENAGASDVYDGGSGVDALRLVMTRTEWLSAAVQQDVAGYLAFIAAATNPNNGQASNAEYVFRAFGLNASKFERLEVIVDGVAIDPRDQAVVLGGDAMIAGEDAPSLALDVLLNDSVADLVSSLSFTQPAHGTATLVARTSGAGAGSETAKFVYTPSPTHWQYLAAGETATDSFTYKVTDADGDQQTATVTVTITGANDAPTITSAVSTGATVEDGAMSANGVIAFADVDLSNSHAVTATPNATGYLGVFSTAVTNASTGDGAGAVGWTFSVDPATIQHLAKDQVATQLYTVTVADNQGGSVQQVVAVTITGTNDAPTISAATTATGAVTERADGASDENTATLTASGAVAFADVDLTDTHSATFTPAGPGYIGALTLGTVDQAANTVGWTFATADGALDFLAAGEIRTQTYVLTVSDGPGGSASQTLTMTLTGSNDAPTITSALATAATVEDGVMAAVGSVAFADVDLADTHTVSSAAQANGYFGTFAATASDAATGDGAGAVGWTFSVDPATIQHLAKDQVLTQLYTITVSDNQGASVQQVVAVTITGANDAPTARTDTLTGATENQTLTFDVLANDTDVDVGAQLTLVSVTGPPGKGVASVVDGKVRFEPGTDFDYLPPGGSETVVLTYVMRDEHGATSTANLVIQQIAGVNDAPVAAADLAGTGENQSVTVDVLANDTDVDMGSQFTLVSASAPKGSASMVGGKVVFNPGTAFDHLAVGGSENVVLNYVMRDQFGATSASTVTVAVAGANDPASISGLSAGTVQEDGTLTATGNLSVTDVDSGQAHFQAPAAAALNGLYGLFTFHDGAWTYALNNGAANVQALKAGQTVHDRLTVTSLDGTAVRDIEVAITGADDFRFAQLLQDFSFENNAAGWTNIGGTALEIVSDQLFGIVGDGRWLDTQATPGGITIGQTVDVATGQRATLSFSVAAERSANGLLHPNSTLSFEFNGVVVKTITEADFAAYNQLRTFTVDVVGQAGADTLRIHDNGTGSVGYALDWVRLDGWILI